MEQTALRPKPMPGQGPTDKDPADGGARRPHAAPRRRGRRLANLAGAVLAALVLVLAGVGLGTLGSTVIGMRELAALQHRSAPAPTAPAPVTTSPAPATTGATLGVEAVDTRGPGALVVAVHVPGPGYTAGLVRGDVVLALGRSRVDDAASLARAVSRTRPGHGITLTVRHTNGTRQHLTAVPGITT